MTHQPPIFAAVERDIERGWDAFTGHLHHAHYHDHDTTATPAPEAPDMSVLTEAKTLLHDGIAKLEGLDETVVGTLEKVAANPGAMKLITAAEGVLHLPPEAFEVGIAALQKVAELYDNPETASPAPVAPADPAMGQQPEPAPEPQPASV